MTKAMPSKPKAVLAVEANAPSAVTEAWAKLESGASISDDDLPLIVAAARANRQRWLLKQKEKGKDE